MAAINDYSTGVNKVRLLISDIDHDPAGQIFNDDAIQAAIDMATDGNLKRAAAQLLMSIAINETLIQKRINILDLQTDGPAQAIQLRLLAKQYRDEADREETAGNFDWAEMVLDTQTHVERLHKEALRDS